MSEVNIMQRMIEMERENAVLFEITKTQTKELEKLEKSFEKGINEVKESGNRRKEEIVKKIDDNDSKHTAFYNKLSSDVANLKDWVMRSAIGVLVWIVIQLLYFIFGAK